MRHSQSHLFLGPPGRCVCVSTHIRPHALGPHKISPWSPLPESSSTCRSGGGGGASKAAEFQRRRRRPAKLSARDHRRHSTRRPAPSSRWHRPPAAAQLLSRGVSRRKIVLSNLASGRAWPGRAEQARRRASITHTQTDGRTHTSVGSAGTHHGLECVSAERRRPTSFQFRPACKCRDA